MNIRESKEEVGLEGNNRLPKSSGKFFPFFAWQIIKTPKEHR